MVKGEWIVLLETRRCRNWVNGTVITFTINEHNIPQGAIRHIPQAVLDRIPPGIDQAIFAYRMWRKATLLFRKAYQRRLEQRKPPKRHAPRPALVRIT